MCFNVHCNISSSVCSECQPVHCLLVASSLALKPDLPSCKMAVAISLTPFRAQRVGVITFKDQKLYLQQRMLSLPGLL